MDRIVLTPRVGEGGSKEDYYYSHALRPDDVKLLGRHLSFDHNNRWQQEHIFGRFSQFEMIIYQKPIITWWHQCLWKYRKCGCWWNFLLGILGQRAKRKFSGQIWGHIKKFLCNVFGFWLVDESKNDREFLCRDRSQSSLTKILDQICVKYLASDW